MYLEWTKLSGIGTRRMAYRHQIGSTGAGIAERTFGHRGAELVEQGIADIEAVDDALGAKIAARQDRLGAVLSDDRLPFAGDLGQRGTP